MHGPPAVFHVLTAPASPPPIHRHDSPGTESGLRYRELRALLAQPTAETGQPFSTAAVEAVWTGACGQPCW